MVERKWADEGRFRRMGLLGVGFMGASIAKSVRQRSICREVIGLDPNPDHIRLALREGIIDGEADVRDLIRCDLLVLAAPIRANIDFIRSLPDILKGAEPWGVGGGNDGRRGIILDLGSTKESIVRAASKLPDAFPLAFIGGHPLAGSERDGPDSADGDLFVGRPFFITPGGGLRQSELERIEALIRTLGAEAVLIDPGEHDLLMARISHLPHLLACMLVDMKEAAPGGGEEGEWMVGQGFLDLTRIAAGNPEVWRDIMIDNREGITRTLEAFRKVLHRVEGFLSRGDGEALYRFLNHARRIRRNLAEKEG